MTEEITKKFNIQLASQLSGLSAHTIRAWEKRYKALSPSRNDHGRRLYTTEEIDRLLILAQLTQLGTSIGQIAHLPDEELKEIYQKLIHKGSQDEAQKKNPTQGCSLSDIREKLLEAVGKYQVDVISQLLSEAKSSLGPKSFALDILSPLVDEVKKRRSQNLFQDAQAQALFAITKFHAGNIIYSHFERAPRSNSRIILTSVEKEHHTFSLLVSALLCCHHKKDFFYLNSNLPAPSIIEAVKATEASLLLLTVPPLVNFDEEVTALLDEVIKTISDKIKIWAIGDIGGNQHASFPWKNVKKIFHYNQLDEALSTQS